MRIIRKLSAIVLTSVLTLSIVLSAWSMAETETEAAAWQYPEVLKVPPADLSPLLHTHHNTVTIAAAPLKQGRLSYRICSVNSCRRIYPSDLQTYPPPAGKEKHHET